MRKKAKLEMKVTYNYLEPKTRQEAEEAQRRLDSAFDILFEATARRQKRIRNESS